VAVGCDLEDADALSGTASRMGRRLGPVGCLVNNGRWFEYDSIESLEARKWERHVNVNLRAPLLLAAGNLGETTARNCSGAVIVTCWTESVNLNPDFLSSPIAKIGPRRGDPGIGDVDCRHGYGVCGIARESRG